MTGGAARCGSAAPGGACLAVACLLAVGLLLGCAATRPVAEVPVEAPADSATIVFALRDPRQAVHDDRCFRDATPWAAPQEVFLAAPSRLVSLFDWVRWEQGSAPPGLAARDEVQRRLGLDALKLGGSEIRVRKDYGRRLSLYTTTGLGASSEEALEAEYVLWQRWYLRSQTREGGESSMEFRREVTFR